MRKNKLVLIEDLAHSVGAVGKDGKKVGFYGDAMVFSFGRDKMVDAISGGAEVVRSYKKRVRELKSEIEEGPMHYEMGGTGVSKDLIYPLLTLVIRWTYGLGIGKLIHELARRVGLMGSPVDNDVEKKTWMPDALASLVLGRFRLAESNLFHRQEISKVYFDNLPKSSCLVTRDEIGSSACLRYPMVVGDRKDLFEYLEKHGIYISDTWYDKPVVVGRKKVRTEYKKGSCLNAEKLSSMIVNLPTHREVDREMALKVSELVSRFIKEESE